MVLVLNENSKQSKILQTSDCFATAFTNQKTRLKFLVTVSSDVLFSFVVVTKMNYNSNFANLKLAHRFDGS